MSWSNKKREERIGAHMKLDYSLCGIPLVLSPVRTKGIPHNESVYVENSNALKIEKSNGCLQMWV